MTNAGALPANAPIPPSGVAVPPGARVTRTADFTGIASATDTAVPFDRNTSSGFNRERAFQTDSMHSTSTNNTRITCNTAGLFLVGASVAWSPNTTGTRFVALQLNGAPPFIARDSQPTIGAGTSENVSHEVITAMRLTVGDYVEVVVRQDAGINLSLVLVASNAPVFWAVWRGP